MLIKNGRILQGNDLVARDVRVEGGVIAAIGELAAESGERVIDVYGCWIIPGAADVHVHLRQPGFEQKETVATATAAAAKGGYTAVMAMPNLSPVPDCISSLKVETDVIDKSALVRVYPFAALTANQNGETPSDIEELAALVKGFSDDGKCVNNQVVLSECMRRVKSVNGIISSHAEAADAPAEDSERLAVCAELETLKKINCRYHFCHLSTEKALKAVKNAQLSGVDVTCEVTPHHLFLCDEDGVGDTNFKMSPPLRPRADMNYTVSALLDGTAAIITTDHAPHTEAEKAKPYSTAPNGIIGLETALPLVYTKLVRTGLATYGDMLNWTVHNPRRRFSLPPVAVEVGAVADLAVLDVEREREYTRGEILSKSTNSPYVGMRLYGFNRLTLVGGEIRYDDFADTSAD